MTTLAHMQWLGAPEKRLAAAVAVSIAVHALAWLLVPPLRTQIAPLVRTLEVLLVAPQPQPRTEVAAAPQLPRPKPPTLKPRVAERALEPPPPQEPVAVPREPEPVAPADTTQHVEPTPPIITRPPEPEPVAVAVAPLSPELLAGYGNSISRLLAKYREYPRVALVRGWEGTVTMRLSVAPGGKLIGGQVESSSGHKVLDEQALEMVKRMAELPPPPAGLRDREFAVLVPVVFRLER